MLPYGFLSSAVFDFVKKRVAVKKIPLWYFLTWALGMAGIVLVFFLLIGLSTSLADYKLILSYAALAVVLGGLVGLLCAAWNWLIWCRKDYKKLKNDNS